MTIKTRISTRFKNIFENAPPSKQAPRFLVPYDGSSSSNAALRQAIEMAPARTRVVAVFLDVTPLSQEIEGSAPTHEMLSQAILAAAIVNAQLYGRRIETLSVPCHVKGPAQVALASERENTTLFLGVDESNGSPHSDPFLSYVTSLAPCKVILVGSEALENSMPVE